MDPKQPSYEEVRDTINRVMNIDTSDVTIEPQDNKMEDENKEMEGQDPKADMPPAEVEPAGAAGAGMTLAQLAEKVGVDEAQLKEFLEQSGLLEKVGGMEGLLQAISQNPEMLEEIVGLIKSVMGEGGAASIPVVG